MKGPNVPEVSFEKLAPMSWGSPIVFFVWGLPYSSNRHVTPVSVRGRKGLTCSIRAPPRPRFDTLRQSVSNRAQLFLAVYQTFFRADAREGLGTKLMCHSIPSGQRHRWHTLP